MPETDGKCVAETKISKNRTTTVPEPIRTAESLDVGDHVQWRLIDDEWVLRPVEDGGECTCDDADSEGGH
ncbi:AbrB/MazE/SpoVT family DNA-binding domain-containing protein [Natrialbaceae archaeon GCM10025810]